MPIDDVLAPAPDPSLRNFEPMPQATNFTRVLARAADAAASVAGGVLEVGAESVLGIDTSKLAALMEKQVKSQEIMQTYSMASNISRTEHETAMTSIRNARLG